MLKQLLKRLRRDWEQTGECRYVVDAVRLGYVDLHREVEYLDLNSADRKWVPEPKWRHSDNHYRHHCPRQVEAGVVKAGATLTSSEYEQMIYGDCYF